MQRKFLMISYVMKYDEWERAITSKQGENTYKQIFRREKLEIGFFKRNKIIAGKLGF